MENESILTKQYKDDLQLIKQIIILTSKNIFGVIMING